MLLKEHNERDYHGFTSTTKCLEYKQNIFQTDEGKKNNGMKKVLAILKEQIEVNKMRFNHMNLFKQSLKKLSPSRSSTENSANY